MEERFSMSYNQAYPRAPRGWTSSEFNSRLGLTQCHCATAPETFRLLFLVVRAALRIETLKAGRSGAYFPCQLEDGGQQSVRLERLAQHSRRPLEGRVGELFMAVC
jgi:hypothetical protein